MDETNKKNSTFMSFKQLPSSCHVCLIFDNDEQREKIVSAYVSEGIENGEMVRYFNDKTPKDKINYWLKNLKIDIEKLKKDSFSIIDANDAYLTNGEFVPPSTINNIKQRYKIAEKSGFTGSRVASEMSWALKGMPGSERLLEYEVLLNFIDVDFPHTGMCQYDARLFDGITLFKILQVHPFVIAAQGQIVQNPYYIKPEEFIANNPM